MRLRKTGAQPEKIWEQSFPMHFMLKRSASKDIHDSGASHLKQVPYAWVEAIKLKDKGPLTLRLCPSKIIDYVIKA